MNTKKPEIEQFIGAFNVSSNRTRTLLIGLLFASILAFIALLDSLVPLFSWYSSRIAIQHVALQWFVFPEDHKNDKIDFSANQVVASTQSTQFPRNEAVGYGSISDFACALECQSGDINKLTQPEIDKLIRDAVNLRPWLMDVLNYIKIDENKPDLPYWVKIKPFEPIEKKFPNKGQRAALYQNITRAATVFNGSSPHSRKELEFALENLMEAQSENLTLVRMPILGISFDINFLGFISGGIFFALMALLYLSMVREDRNLKTLFLHGWEDDDTDNRRLYELVSMYQVLTVPQKLYRPDNRRDMLTRKIILGVFWGPFLVLASIFLYDIYSFQIGLSLNPLMTVLTSCLTLISLILIGYTSMKLTNRQTRINRLWDNQYFRLHLDNFLSTNLQKEETSPFATLDQAKINWANTVFKVGPKKSMSEKECVKHFRQFLNLCYDKFEDKLNENITQEQLANYWEKLESWYKVHRTYSTRKQFRKELTQMMNNIHALNPPNSQSPITN